MTILINSKLFAGVLVSFNTVYAAPVSNIYLCVGSMPTDAQVDAMVNCTTDTLITNNRTATYGGITAANMKAKDQNIPTLMYSAILPNPSVVNATRSGTIGWGVLMYDATHFSIADVGLPNSGACIQVDVVNVIVGTPVTLAAVSYKMGR